MEVVLLMFLKVVVLCADCCDKTQHVSVKFTPQINRFETIIKRKFICLRCGKIRWVHKTFMEKAERIQTMEDWKHGG